METAIIRTDYGTAGRIGVLVPSGNPTVEPELSILLGPDIAMLTARMTSAASAMNARLEDYGRRIDRYMADFGGVAFDAIVFACTGTSYLLCEPLPERLSGPGGRAVPLISAAGALEKALAELSCRRITLISPYPADLTDAAVSYWRGRGLSVVTVVAPAPSTSGYHPIYTQSATAMREAIERATASQPDAVVVLGTGAPSLAAIGVTRGAIPVISSNLSLAWAVETALKAEAACPLRSWVAPDAAWKERLRVRFPGAAIVPSSEPRHTH